MKKVLILGLAKTMESAPKEYDGEVWTCNDGAFRRTHQFGKPYITAMFDVHDLNVALPSEKQAATLCETFNIPIYGVCEYPWLRNSVVYPKAEIVAKFGLDLFSDVICYMIALAIHQEFEHIDLYGVHLHPKQRDHQEAAIVHFWLGVAYGRGINVTIHDYEDDSCAILKNGEYWTGEGAYGHWDAEYRLLLEAEARKNPLKPPEDMPVKEVDRDS